MIEQLRVELQNYWDGVVSLIPKLAIALIFLLIFILIGILLGKLVNRRIAPKMKDPLLARFIVNTVKMVIVIIGIIGAMNILGMAAVAASLLAGAGVTAIILGFAFKDIGENFLAGILLAFSRPFKVGDIVETGDVVGKIVSMNLRNIQLKTADGKDVFIPNALIIKQPLINYTIDGFLRFEFIVGIDTGEDVIQASKVIKDIIYDLEGVLQKREINVLVHEFAPSTVNLKVQYWIDTFDKKVNGIRLKSLVMEKVKTGLLSAGFSLPSDIVELKIYNQKMPIPVELLNKAV